MIQLFCSETSNTINTIVTSNQSNEIDYTTTFPVEFEEEFATTPFPDVNLTRIVGGWPAKAGQFLFQAYFFPCNLPTTI
jgi:hypothetical protein